MEVLNIILLIVFIIWNIVVSILFVKEKKTKEFLRILQEGMKAENEFLRKSLRELSDQITLKNPRE